MSTYQIAENLRCLELQSENMPAVVLHPSEGFSTGVVGDMYIIVLQGQPWISSLLSLHWYN